jgi:hypothetical protein
VEQSNQKRIQRRYERRIACTPAHAYMWTTYDRHATDPSGVTRRIRGGNIGRMSRKLDQSHLLLLPIIIANDTRDSHNSNQWKCFPFSTVFQTTGGLRAACCLPDLNAGYESSQVLPLRIGRNIFAASVVAKYKWPACAHESRRLMARQPIGSNEPQGASNIFFGGSHSHHLLE